MSSKDFKKERKAKLDAIRYQKNKEKINKRNKENHRKNMLNPEYREKIRLYKEKQRREKGSIRREIITLRTKIKNIPKPLTVLDLISYEQKNYWIERRKTNEGRAEYSKHLYNKNFLNNIMHKEKNQRKKFQDYGNYVEKVSAKLIENRFKLFNYCCAYCGSYEGFKIQIEHVVPKSKQGPHCMANIVPACHKCNQSKFNYPMEKWYKNQSFYTEERLKKIKKVLEKTPYPPKQNELFHNWEIQ